MKKVVYCWYMHRSNTEDILKLPREAIDRISLSCFKLAQQNYKFEVIKYNSKTNAISLIDCLDWNEAYEPVLRTIYSISKDGQIFIKLNGYQVYHQKHLFVSPDYKGFDIEDSKERTKLLETIPMVKENKSKIGSLAYWNKVLEVNNLPRYMSLESENRF